MGASWMQDSFTSNNIFACSHPMGNDPKPRNGRIVGNDPKRGRSVAGADNLGLSLSHSGVAVLNSQSTSPTADLGVVFATRSRTKNRVRLRTESTSVET